MSEVPRRTDGRTRVLWLITGLGAGGAERLLVFMARTGDHSRFNYEAAYVLGWKDALVDDLEGAGITVHALGVNDIRDLRWVVRLRKLLLSRRYDLVHVHSPFPAVAARLVTACLRRSDRPRLLSTEHNVWDAYSPASRFLNAWTASTDAARLAVSDVVRASMPCPHQRSVEVVVHGLLLDEVRAEREHRQQLRSELGVTDGEVLAVTVANLRPEKAYPDLLRAARIVLDGGHPVRFVAVGQGPLEDRVRRQIAQMGLSDGFRLLGYRPDAVRILAAGDLFVLSSHHEGFPVALMEALAVGVPVVSTAVGGTRSVIRDGVEGFLVPPRQPEQLAARIIDLATDFNRRKVMAAAAERRGQDFDIRHAIGRIEQIYRELTAPKSSAGTDPSIPRTAERQHRS